MAYQNNFKNSVKTEGGTRKKQDHNHDKVDAIDIISDYLRKFHDHVIKKIIGPEIKQNLLRGLFSRQKTKEDFNIRYVLTVPAMWSASAKETMAQASIEAGIIKKNELHKLRIITEPEAAALFCDKGYSKFIRDPAKPERESNFVVCDAGGGTVDLVTFGLKQHEKTGKPMIYQVGEGSGDTCGSSYLDSNFKEYILKFYEDMCVSVNLYNTDFNFVMDQFTKIKIKFNPDNDKDGYNDIKLPTERPIPYDRKTGKYMLRESRTEIRVMDTVMKEEIFDPIIDNIIRLINKQIKQAKDDSREIKSIILIGGFSRNPYLQNRIKNHYHNLYGICVPAEGVAAISHGAVSYGLNPRMVTTRLAGQSVALEVQAPFETKNENKYKEVLGPKGEKFVRNRLEYFVKKMDPIQGEIYHKTVSINYPQNVLIGKLQVKRYNMCYIYSHFYILAIFSCDFKEGEEADDKNWRYVSNKHSKIMEEIIELPEVEGLEKGTNIEFDVSLKMDHIGVTVVIESVNNIIPGKANDNGRKLIMERKCNFVVFRNKKSLVQYSLTKSRFAYGSS
ncbi:hypothetical protein BDF21DRAFT_333175 [Thamnidium elegans]|nr:hypothetical protein BDF21DRAFT_333175 [Thamnidium elegans]